MKKKGDKKQHAWLVKAIETQVIPRLMLAHKSDREKAESQVHLNRNKHIFSKEAIHDFTQVLLNNDADISKTYVEALIDEGVNLEDVYLELFQPSARLLGTIWEEDTEDFSAVTLALWKMQQTMYYFSDSFLNESQLIQRKGTVFLCPYPGSQHSMGLFMVSEFFRKDNWNVLGDPSITSNDLKTKISKNFFDILGISDIEASEKFGFLMNAFKYGAPPHGGMAFGFDRIVMLLAGSNQIRDVIAFPKTTSATSLMDNSPSNVDKSQLDELGLDIKSD